LQTVTSKKKEVLQAPCSLWSAHIGADNHATACGGNVVELMEGPRSEQDIP